jgi:hypothetical protein
VIPDLNVDSLLPLSVAAAPAAATGMPGTDAAETRSFAEFLGLQQTADEAVVNRGDVPPLTSLLHPSVTAEPAVPGVSPSRSIVELPDEGKELPEDDAAGEANGSAPLEAAGSPWIVFPSARLESPELPAEVSATPSSDMSLAPGTEASRSTAPFESAPVPVRQELDTRPEPQVLPPEQRDQMDGSGDKVLMEWFEDPAVARASPPPPAIVSPDHEGVSFEDQPSPSLLARDTKPGPRVPTGERAHASTETAPIDPIESFENPVVARPSSRPVAPAPSSGPTPTRGSAVLEQPEIVTDVGNPTIASAVTLSDYASRLQRDVAVVLSGPPPAGGAPEAASPPQPETLRATREPSGSLRERVQRFTDTPSLADLAVGARRAAPGGPRHVEPAANTYARAPVGAREHRSGVPLPALPIAPEVLLHATAGRLTLAGVSGAPPSANDVSLRSSIVRAIQMQWKDGTGTAVIKLDPAYLGTLTVSLRVESGLVTATLRADDPQVRAWLASSEATLRQGLAEQGLTLERIAVADQAEHEAQADAERRQRSRQAFDRRRTPLRGNPDKTFEVIV